MLTLPALKTALGITGTTDDVFLQAQLDYYTAVIQLFVRRKLVRATYIDTFYRPGTRSVHLCEWPVLSVARVEVDDAAQTANAWEVEPGSGRLWRGNLGAGTFACARKVLCEYTGGLDPLPKDLELVLVSLIRGALDNQTSGGIAAAGASAGGSDQVKSFTAFGVAKIDYDTSASSSSAVDYQRKQDADLSDLLGNHVGILMRYRDDSRVIATATG